MLKKNLTYLLLFVPFVSFSQEASGPWQIGLDLGFGISKDVFALDGEIERSQLLTLDEGEEPSHSLLAGVSVYRTLTPKLRIQTGANWTTYSSKRLYTASSAEDIDPDSGFIFQVEGDPENPTTSKVRTTYGFVSVPFVLQYMCDEDKMRGLILEAGGAINGLLYSHAKETTTYDNSDNNLRQGFFDSVYETLSLSVHTGIKFKLDRGVRRDLNIGPNFDMMFQTLEVDGKSEKVNPYRISLSCALLL